MPTTMFQRGKIYFKQFETKIGIYQREINKVDTRSRLKAEKSVGKR